MTETNLNYASLNRRVIASSIDILILTLILTPLSHLLDWLFFGHKSMMILLTEFFKENDNQVDSEQLWLFISSNYLLVKYLIVQFILFLVMAACFILFWIRTNQTIGKMITKCVIIDANTGAAPTKKQYIIRFFSYLLSTIILCIGFFMIALTKKNKRDRLFSRSL